MRLPLACASAVLSTCLPAFQRVCPDVYLFACLPASLFITFVHLFAAFLSAFLPAFQPVYLSFCPLVCLSSSLPSSQPICPLVYLFGFLSACLSAIRPILLSTCLFAYQPAFKMSFLPEFSACIPVLLSARFNCYLPASLQPCQFAMCGLLRAVSLVLRYTDTAPRGNPNLNARVSFAFLPVREEQQAKWKK